MCIAFKYLDFLRLVRFVYLCNISLAFLELYVCLAQAIDGEVFIFGCLCCDVAMFVVIATVSRKQLQLSS